MRRLADGGMRGLARLLVHVFFRDIELEHGDRLPATGPVVLVANHLNGLVDGLLLIATLGRYPRFLGKSTLFKILPLWPFLKFAGVIPVYRIIDGAPGDHNVSAFATCHEILVHGGTVALFPEGISHDESSLQPLRTGAARIALDAGADGAVEVVTVAVGLTYDAKARFRSRALVRVAEPVRISSWIAAHESDGRDAVRQLTDDVARQLISVSPTFGSWEQAERLSRVADVVARLPEGNLPADVTMADRVAVTERLARVEDDGVRRAEVGALVEAFDTYERDLHLLGLSDAQVAARYPQGKLRSSLVWSGLKVIAALPLAAVGVIVHVVPYQIVKQVAKKPTNEGMKATIKLLGCFALFTLVYISVGVLVGRAMGPWAGLAAAVAAPLCGYVSVRLAERVTRVGGLLAGYRTVTGRRDVLATVFAHRVAVVDAAGALLAPP